MTNEQKTYIADVLLTAHLLGADQIFPLVYVVSGHPYWFYHAALRASGNDPRKVEMMTAEEAWTIKTRRRPSSMRHNLVNRQVDQRGYLFPEGSLYCDHYVKPCTME